jgi:hypothetical protein
MENLTGPSLQLFIVNISKQIHVLFNFGPFNDAVSTLQCTPLDDRMNAKN